MLRRTFAVLFFSALLVSSDAHFLSVVWPQKGLEANEAGAPDAVKKVLIAGYGSDFRDTVVNRLGNLLRKDSVFVRVIDMKDVAKQDPHAWSAVLLVNRCVVGDCDSRVKDFVKSHSDSKNIVLFTTSGDPKGCFPDNKIGWAPGIDGYSSASSMDRCDNAVNALYAILGGMLTGRLEK